MKAARRLLMPATSVTRSKSEAIFEHIRQEHGRLDILVNNAAANPYYGHITDTDMAAFTKTVEVNIRGYFFMSANACKLMQESGGGAIVNVSSVDGSQAGRQTGHLLDYQKRHHPDDQGVCAGMRARQYPGQRPAAGADRDEIRRRPDRK